MHMCVCVRVCVHAWDYTLLIVDFVGSILRWCICQIGFPSKKSEIRHVSRCVFGKSSQEARMREKGTGDRKGGTNTIKCVTEVAAVGYRAWSSRISEKHGQSLQNWALAPIPHWLRVSSKNINSPMSLLHFYLGWVESHDFGEGPEAEKQQVTWHAFRSWVLSARKCPLLLHQHSGLVQETW